MNYPRPVMSKSELHNEMGFSMDYLNRIVHSRHAKKFCWKKNERAKNSKFFFDTEKFEKMRQKGEIG